MIFPIKPLTGGLMVIEIPSRKGCRLYANDSNHHYHQQTTQSLHNLSDDVINFMAVKPLSDEVSYVNGVKIIKLKHPFQKRLQYWLNDHFLTLIGGMNYHPERCTWKFNHNQY